MDYYNVYQKRYYSFHRRNQYNYEEQNMGYNMITNRIGAPPRYNNFLRKNNLNMNYENYYDFYRGRNCGCCLCERSKSFLDYSFEVNRTMNMSINENNKERSLSRGREYYLNMQRNETFEYYEDNDINHMIQSENNYFIYNKRIKKRKYFRFKPGYRGWNSPEENFRYNHQSHGRIPKKITFYDRRYNKNNQYIHNGHRNIQSRDNINENRFNHINQNYEITYNNMPKPIDINRGNFREIYSNNYVEKNENNIFDNEKQINNIRYIKKILEQEKIKIKAIIRIIID